MKGMLATVVSMLFIVSLSGNEIRLENSKTAFVFSQERNFALVGILNKETGREIELGRTSDTPPPALWEMVLLDGISDMPGIIGDKTGRAELLKKDGGKELRITWEGMKTSRGDMRVEASFFLPDDDTIAECSLRATVSGKPAPWIKTVIFPALRGIKSLGDDYLVEGEFLGRIVKNPTKRLDRVSVSHPGTWSMQFAAFHGSKKLTEEKTMDSSWVNGFHRGPADDETGLFLSAADGAGHAKRLEMYRKQTQKDSFNMETEHFPSFDFWPPTKKERGETFTYEMPYKVRLGSYSGGTGKACALYRAWALKQPWMSRGPIRSTSTTEKNRISPKALDCAFWGKFYHEPGKVVPELAAFREYLRTPVNTHWYRYYISEFDNNNLEYTPVDPYFREGVRDLKKMGVGVMPYVCCAVWDMDLESWDKHGMSKAAAMSEAGHPYIWPLYNQQPNAWMNPASELWRNKFVEMSRKMFNDWNTDGEYLDVLAAEGGDKLCYDDKLNRPHGGNYWAEGNRKILEGTRKNLKEVTPDGFLTAESFTENYIDLLDGYLTLDIGRYGWAQKGVNKDNFPLLSQVYHDHTITFGSDCGQQLTAESHRWQMGLCFTWGVQPTYSSTVILKPEAAKNGNDEYTREIARAWHQSGWKFLSGGLGIETALTSDKALGGNAPVTVASKAVTVNCDSHFLKNLKWHGPSVLGSAWKAFDGTIGVTLTNITSSDTTAEIILDMDKLETPHKVLWRTWPLAPRKMGEIAGRHELAVTVPAASAMIFELRDESEPQPRPLEEISWKLVSAGKDGSFEPQNAEGGTLWGCADSITQNSTTGKDNVLRLVSPRTKSPRKLASVVEWGKNEGHGKPRNPEDKPFYLLEKTPLTLSCEGEAMTQYAGGVVYGRVSAKTNGVLSGPSGSVIVICPEEGTPETHASKAPLTPGSHRFAAWLSDETIGAPDKADTTAWLAKHSTLFAKDAERRLTSDKNISNKERAAAERLLTAANAMTFVAIGGECHEKMDGDWAIPLIPFDVSFNTTPGAGKISKTTLSVLKPRMEKHLSVKKTGQDTFELKASSDAQGNLVPALFKAEASSGRRSFSMANLVFIEIDQPLLAEITREKAIVMNVAPGKVAETSILVKNVSPHDLEISVSADLPDGWSLAQEKDNAKFLLKKLSCRTLPVRIKTSETESGKEHDVTVWLNHTDDKTTRIHETVKVIMKEGSLTTVSQVVKNTDPKWSPPQRHNGQMAIMLDPGSEAVVELRPFSLTGSIPPADWKLLDDEGRQVAAGQVKPGNESNPIRLKAEKPGAHFLVYNCNFFDVRVDSPSGHAFAAQAYRPFILFARDNKPHTMYFHVPKHAKDFQVSGVDGGPSEPASVTIRDSEGKNIFARNGSWQDNGWFTVNVPENAGGMIWSMEVLAVQDLQIKLKGDVVPWLSTSPESVLKFKE